MVRSLAILVAVACAAPLFGKTPEEPTVKMSFNKARLIEVLNLYQVLTDRPVLVSKELQDRPVSINTDERIPRSEAVKLVESRLLNYDIRIAERDGVLVAVGPNESEATLFSPVMRPNPQGKAEDNGWLYKETEGLAGSELKDKLQDTTSKRHMSISYDLTKDVLMAIDEDPANTNNAITLYERKSVPKANFAQGDPSVAWDRVHVLPQSYGARDGRFAKSDLHNLFLSLREVNTLRGSLYFDESGDDKEIPEKAPLASHDADSWEPPDEIKGDIARVVFYMDIRYDGSDSKQDIKIAEVANRGEGVFGNLRTLLDWHQADPVSDEEKERNDEIYFVQGNRNPFVDRPEFAETIYREELVGQFSAASFYGLSLKQLIGRLGPPSMVRVIGLHDGETKSMGFTNDLLESGRYRVIFAIYIHGARGISDHTHFHFDKDKEHIVKGSYNNALFDETGDRGPFEISCSRHATEQ